MRPNPSWSLDHEHEVIVEVTGVYRYNGSLEDAEDAKVGVKADNISLTARHSLIGGKHFVSTTITNNTLVGSETPSIKVSFDYTDGRERAMKFSLPTNESVFRFDSEDEEICEQVYHYDINMDPFWEEGLGEGLRGAYFSLVDSEGRQVSNETVYLRNPEEEYTDIISGTVKDEEGNALEGAKVVLYAAGSDEALCWTFSGEDGSFVLGKVEKGSYTVRATEVPEAYIPGPDCSVAANGDGEILEVSLICMLIRGNVIFVIKDEEDPEKMVPGAKVSVYKDGKKAGELEEVQPGVYELRGLPYGDYTVVIDKAPEGYAVTDIENFSIRENGLTVYVSAVGRIKSPDSPGTGEKLIPIYIMLMVTSILYAAYLYGKIRKTKI